MKIERKRTLCHPEDQLLELVKRYFDGSLESREQLGKFKKPSNLRAISHDRERTSPRLSQIVSSDDVKEVVDRLEHTAIFYMGKTLWGFLVLTLEVLVGEKEADKGDLVLYPSPNNEHFKLAVRVFDLYLEEQLNKIDLQPPKDLDNTMLLAPKDKDLARRMMEADMICHGRI